MPEEAKISFTIQEVEIIIFELYRAIEPMVPYKQDQLEFSTLAHTIKNKHIKNVLGHFPSDLVNSISNKLIINE